MEQAFPGIKVIDFTQIVSGPFATEQLALLGADVIKVEPRGFGDPARVIEKARRSLRTRPGHFEW